MSTDSSLVPEGAVTLYYPPLSIPKSPGTTNNDTSETKQCSVRGCTLLLPLSSSNKMCETCRGRHRVYASTKRARRKMEKAAVAGVVAARARVGEVGGVNGGEDGGVTAVWMPLSVGDQSEVGQRAFFFSFRTMLMTFVDRPRHPSPTRAAGPASAGARMGPRDRSASFSRPRSGCCYCAFCFVFSADEFASPPASCDDDVNV